MVRGAGEGDEAGALGSQRLAALQRRREPLGQIAQSQAQEDGRAVVDALRSGQVLAKQPLIDLSQGAAPSRALDQAGVSGRSPVQLPLLTHAAKLLQRPAARGPAAATQAAL